jgi:hypothetical protein
MKERLDRLNPGDELVVWKALEEAGENKVRVLVHFETRPKREDSASGAPPSSDTASSPPKPVLLGGEQSSGDASVVARFEALPTKTKIAVAKRARAAGINVSEPTGDAAHTLSTIIDEEEHK